ncbi:hypothetical protein HID58_070244 [Brassica napus]|uniref:F-box associated beta-propeller type 3 domain-containing protein n=1 Tax=Brassica napus TaxID=3708 RepID=A0ABQ7YY74_BRANA|nr:hypothetical protein HID58_070244 [Brassica napus]
MDEELLLARIIAGFEGGGGDDESHYHELVADLKSLLDTDDDEILDRPISLCPVFTFFSPVAFLSLLGSIRRYLKPRRREDSGAAASSQGNKKKRGRGGGSRKNARNPGREDGDETEEGGFDAKLVFRVLERLGSVLGFVHLDRFPDSLKSLVQTVSEIPLLAAEISKSLTPLLLMGKHQARSFALGFVSRKIMGLAKDNSELKKVVCNLPKFLVHKAPEKAEPRGFAVEAILEIVKAMEVEDQSEFVDFVMKMGQGKSNLRILAVDLIPLMMSSLGNPFGSISSEDSVEDSWGLGCVNALVQRCSDSSALIRARALSNLAQVVGFLSGDGRSRSILKQTLGLLVVRLQREKAFRICTDEVVTTEWLHSVPRMVVDNETSIQEECENVFHELVLERISRAGNSLSQGSASLPDNWSSSSKDLDRDIEALFPEGVLVLLRELCNSEVSPWSIIKESESLWLNRSMPINKWTAPAGAWFLLSEVSVFLPKSVEWEFLHHHWQLLDKNDLQEGTDGQGDEEGVECNSSTWAGDRVFLLQTISNVSLQLPPEPAADLADNLLKKIEKFNLHSAEVDAHVKALKTLCVKKRVSRRSRMYNLVLVSFHIRSRDFKMIQVPRRDGDEVLLRMKNVSLIEYGGKVTIIDQTNLREKGMLDLWAVEDAGNRTAGTTHDNKVFFIPEDMFFSLHILSYDLGSNDMTKIEIKGIPDHWFSTDKSTVSVMLMDQSESLVYLET